MANRYLSQFASSIRKGLVIEGGTIQLSAAAAVTGHTFSSLISSVVKSGTGTYTITLADKWVGHISVQATPESSLASLDLFIGSVDVVSAKQIVIKTAVSNVLADVTAASNLHILLLLKNSTAR
jgi:hypothetical protein